MRPVTLYEKPPFPPYVCVYCGVGEPPRKWFIDIGMSLEYYFNPVMDGTPWICDECWNNLRIQVEQKISNWVAEHSAWDSPDRVAASYTWKDSDTLPFQAEVLELPEIEEEEDSDVRGSESGSSESTVTRGLDFGSGTDSGIEGDGSDTESDDSDDESSDESASVTYAAIFGERPNPGS